MISFFKIVFEEFDIGLIVSDLYLILKKYTKNVSVRYNKMIHKKNLGIIFYV